MTFSVIIPARYAASRLPAKLLKDIHGKSVLQRTFENAQKSAASRVIIATDDARIKTAAEQFGAQVCMTDKTHASGTARIAQVLQQLAIDDDEIIVNLQGDEPMLPAKVIAQVAQNLAKSGEQMATLCEGVQDEAQYLDPNCVKVVFDNQGRALYFSRAPIPFFREGNFDKNQCFKHIGIYAYRSGFLKKTLKMSLSGYEQAEKLEQLSVLHQGVDIHVEPACAPTGIGVDTAQDLEKVRALLR